MKKRSMILRMGSFLAIFAILFAFVTQVLQDKRVEGEYNPTTKVRGFYAEKKNTLDFVFLGSSQLYADIAPAVLFRDYGMTAYDFAANEQPLWISYYYMKEALRRQKPKAILLDVFTVYGADYEEEGVNHINLDDLPFSLNKLNAIKDSVPRELRYSYYFTIAKYHTTWEGLDEKKFRATFSYGKDPMKGYSPFCVAGNYGESAKESVVSETECAQIPERAKEWLYRMIELSKKEGVDLILIKTPNGNAERQKLYNSVEVIAQKEKIPFINMNTVFDGEAHLNVLQAEKVTEYIGAYLAEHYDITDKRKNSAYADWEESVRLFERFHAKCGLFQCPNLSAYEEYLEGQTDYVVLSAVGGGDKEGSVSICEDGIVLKEKSGKKKLSVSAKADGKSMKVKISDAGDGEKEISIKIDGEEYCINGQGVNIVVYDKILKEVVDTVSVSDDGTFLR